MTMLHRHAYMIMAHGDLYMLQTLVRTLDDPRNDIFIHIDKKWRDFDSAQIKAQHSVVIFTSQRIDARWGDRSLMQVELLLMETATGRGAYSYYHLLSGADLPIKGQDEIHDFFALNAGQEFVFYWNSPEHLADARYKVERYHFGMRYEKGLPRIPSILIAKLRFLITDSLYALLGARRKDAIAKGPNWISITHALAVSLVHRSSEILKRYRWTRNPDEIFVQTLLLGDGAKDRLYCEGQSNSDYRYTRWAKGASSPETLTMSDLEAIDASGCIFARKFSSAIDREVIDTIARRVMKPTEI